MSFHFIWVNTKALTHQAGNWKSSKALFFKFLENYNTMVKSSAGYIVQPPHLKLKSEQISPLWGTRFPSFSELLFSIHWVLFIRQGKKITFFFWFLESRIYFAILTDHFSSKKMERNQEFVFLHFHLSCPFMSISNPSPSPSTQNVESHRKSSIKISLCSYPLSEK